MAADFEDFREDEWQLAKVKEYSMSKLLVNSDALWFKVWENEFASLLISSFLIKPVEDYWCLAICLPYIYIKVPRGYCFNFSFKYLY